MRAGSPVRLFDLLTGPDGGPSPEGTAPERACDRGLQGAWPSGGGAYSQATRNRAARRLVWTLLLLLATCPAGAASSPTARAELKILSYNIQDLPGLVGVAFGRGERYFTRMGELLAERRSRGAQPDLVLIQEGYTARTDRLIELAGYPHVIRGPGPGDVWVGSGLVVLSEYPVEREATRAVSFPALPGGCAEWECLVNKSAVLLKIRLPGAPEPILIATTHLQAQSRNDTTRLRQIEAVAGALREFGFDRWSSIFAGDFNFKPNRHPSYDYFVSATGYRDVGRLCMDSPDSCRVAVGAKSTNGVDKTDLNDVYRSNHDRHFLRIPPDSRIQPIPNYLTRNFLDEIDGHDLSDHYGFEVHYTVYW